MNSVINVGGIVPSKTPMQSSRDDAIIQPGGEGPCRPSLPAPRNLWLEQRLCSDCALRHQQYSAMHSAMSRAARPWHSWSMSDSSVVLSVINLVYRTAQTRCKRAEATAYWLFFTIVRADRVLKSFRNLNICKCGLNVQQHTARVQLFS